MLNTSGDYAFFQIPSQAIYTFPNPAKYGYSIRMAKLQDEIRINFTDGEINNLLSDRTSGPSTVSRHFNQNEEFFLKLSEDFFVPSFPIHHNVTVPVPTSRYLETLKILVMKM